jgi:O-antigen ligase
MILSLLLSGSRSGMLASSIGATYLLYHSQKRAWAAAIVAGVMCIIIAPDVVPYDPFSDDQPFQRLVSGFGTGSGRLEVWPLVLPLIQDRWVLGHGFGTEEFALANAGYLFQEFQGGYFHNSYLGLAYQLGIIGVLLFWGPLLVVFLWQLWRSRHDSKLSLSHVYEAVLLAGLVSAMFESWVYSVGNAFSFPFWICVMLLVRRMVLERERSVGLPSTRPLIASTVTS